MRNTNSGRLAAACFLFLATVSAAAADSLEARWDLPVSLASWYKPQNQRQVWLHTMFALRRELQAVEEYGAAGDWVRLAPWAERFGGHYRKIQDMVPEWGDELDLDALAELERAAAAQDLEALVSARRKLARTCKSCHGEFRALVAARFRAPDFSVLTLRDGEGAERGIAEQMDLLSRALNRIKIATEDGRWEVAVDSLGELRRGLSVLGETCTTCHQDQGPRERILGVSAGDSLDEVAQGLASEDRKRLGRALGEAAVGICARCHGTHRLLSDLVGVVLPPQP